MEEKSDGEETMVKSPLSLLLEHGCVLDDLA